MAFPRLSASMLLASFILLLYWTASSARSHDPTSADLSTPYRMKRDLAFRRREEVAASLVVVKDSLTVVKEVFGKFYSTHKKEKKKLLKDVSKMMKGLANIASLAPGIGGLVFSIVNVALAFIPQENPLKELKKGFAEVNRKLDSLSIQISNLATDVEWFNYASVYSQDEVRILNSWKKFSEFRENSELAQSEEDKLRLAEIFTNYYENTGTEVSVANLYHYLTVSNTFLSKNLNKLLRKKFKCDIPEISKYNTYFSSLLWKGMVLNQLYWRLIGFNSSGKEAEHIQMFKDVYSDQISTFEFCLKNYKQYMKEDVMDISKASSPDNKQAIADQVKNKLNKKYSWYNWVVLVYDSDEDDNHIFYNMTRITVDSIKVAVGYTQKSEEEHKTEVRNVMMFCYKQWESYSDWLGAEQHMLPTCDNIKQNISQCSRDVAGVPVREFVKVMHTRKIDFIKNFVQVPEALQTVYCQWKGDRSYMSVYYSRTITPCRNNTCQNREECKKLLDSNEHRCECLDGWRGDRCEKKINTSDVPEIDRERTVPDITTINAKLKLMEAKLEEILNKCPAQ